MQARRADLAAGIAATVVLWAMAVVPAYTYFEWPRQIETMSLLGVLKIAAILGLVAGAARLHWPPIARLLAVTLGVWLLWCPLTAVPTILRIALSGSAALPGCRGSCVVCTSLFSQGPGGTPVWAVLVFLAIGVAVAVWARPRPQPSDPGGARRTRLLRWGALLCLVGGPIGGAVAWLAFAPGDIYGGPLGLGLLVGLFGLLTFTGHAAFDGLLGRPTLAAAMAPVYGAAVILDPVVLAALSGSVRMTP